MYSLIYEQDFKELAKQATTRILSAGKTSETLDELALHVLSWYDRLAAVIEEEMAETAGAVCCRVGCTYCCGLRIEASAPEVFWAAKHLTEDMDPRARERFVTKIRVVIGKK